MIHNLFHFLPSLSEFLKIISFFPLFLYYHHHHHFEFAHVPYCTKSPVLTRKLGSAGFDHTDPLPSSIFTTQAELFLSRSLIIECYLIQWTFFSHLNLPLRNIQYCLIHPHLSWNTLLHLVFMTSNFPGFLLFHWLFSVSLLHLFHFFQNSKWYQDIILGHILFSSPLSLGNFIQSHGFINQLQNLSCVLTSPELLIYTPNCLYLTSSPLRYSS